MGHIIIVVEAYRVAIYELWVFTANCRLKMFFIGIDIDTSSRNTSWILLLYIVLQLL